MRMYMFSVLVCGALDLYLDLFHRLTLWPHFSILPHLPHLPRLLRLPRVAKRQGGKRSLWGTWVGKRASGVGGKRGGRRVGNYCASVCLPLGAHLEMFGVLVLCFTPGARLQI